MVIWFETNSTFKKLLHLVFNYIICFSDEVTKDFEWKFSSSCFWNKAPNTKISSLLFEIQINLAMLSNEEENSLFNHVNDVPLVDSVGRGIHDKSMVLIRFWGFWEFLKMEKYASNSRNPPCDGNEIGRQNGWAEVSLEKYERKDLVVNKIVLPKFTIHRTIFFSTLSRLRSKLTFWAFSV